MKKLTAVTVAALLMLMGTVTIPRSLPVSAQSEGQWVLQSTDVEIADEPDGHTYNVSEGTASLHSVSASSGDVFAASAQWTKPKNSYRGEETVSLTLSVSVDEYIWNGKDDGYIHDGFNYMSFWSAARIDSPDLGWQYATRSQIQLSDEAGNRRPTVKTDNGDIVTSSESFTVQAVFPAGRSDGEQRSIYITSPVGQNRFNYIWQAGPDTNESSQDLATPTPETQQRQIMLSGGIQSIDSRPMRNLKLSIEAFFLSHDQNEEGSASDWSLQTISDARGGLFQAEIPLPEASIERVKIRITGSLHCLLPDRSLMFYLTDSLETEARDEITFTTTIDVDLNSLEYQDQDQIRINRLLTFRNLFMGHLSIDVNDWYPDAFTSNIQDLEMLAAYSYHYVWAWNAQYVGSVLFGELNELKKYPLRIEMRWHPSDDEVQDKSSHYVPMEQNIIRLRAEHSRFDDSSRFTLLHEYGHHLDSATLDGWYLRTMRAREADTDHTPHGGYLNSSTSDSMIEGFATAYAAIVQTMDRNNQSPHLVDHYDLGVSGNYIAWQNMGHDEELAVATLLYQTYLQYETPRAFWQILKPDYSEFIYYYQELAKNLAANPAALTVLEQAALDGALFQMPFGNGRYDFGEPYRDLNGNGQYDEGEPFGDLMFQTDDSGSIIPDLPLRGLDDDLVLGKSSDAGRDRQTIYQLPGSYLRLSGESVSEVLVKVMPDGEPATQTLRAVQFDRIGQKVYIGLISRPISGTVEVSLPGGSVIYTGDLSELQRLRWENAVLDIPLATAVIRAEDIVDPSVRGAPTYGDPAASGIFEMLSDQELAGMTAEVTRQAGQADPLIALEAAFNDLPESDSQVAATIMPEANQEPNNRLAMFLMISFFVLLFLTTGIVVLILRNRKQPAKSGSHHLSGQAAAHTINRHPAFDEPETAGASTNSSRQYCRNCGKKMEPKSAFCGDCGQSV